MNTTAKTLPTIAEKAGEIVQEIIERELSNGLGYRYPTRFSVRAMYPESWAGQDPHNAQDGSGHPCVVGVTLEDDGYERDGEEDAGGYIATSPFDD